MQIESVLPHHKKSSTPVLDSRFGQVLLSKTACLNNLSLA